MWFLGGQGDRIKISNAWGKQVSSWPIVGCFGNVFEQIEYGLSVAFEI